MKVLFICTHNRCRSILSEALTNHIAGDAIQAYSAGSQPASAVHPLTLAYLKEKGIATEQLRSQSWSEFEEVEPDLVITVCDNAAKESCPIWFGDSIQLHWPLPDPSILNGTEHEIKALFFSVMLTIEERIQSLLDLNLSTLRGDELRLALSSVIEKT